jgi:hypothetical protein
MNLCLESHVEEFEDTLEEYIFEKISKNPIWQHIIELLVIFFKHFISFIESQVITLYSQYIEAMQKVNKLIEFLLIN